MKTLTIKLAAPLQSYSSRRNWTYRDTLSFPTKSAVLGMIGAALGYDKYDSDSDEKILALNKLHFAVRIDQPGTQSVDYQTRKHFVGKKNQSKIINRVYLQDAVFLVAIGSDNAELIEQIQFALHHPKFCLFLGTKSAPPAGYLETELFDKGPLEVLKEVEWKASDIFMESIKQDKYVSKIITDLDLVNHAEDTDVLKDNLTGISINNLNHSARRTASINVDLINPQFEDTDDTSEDQTEAVISLLKGVL